ncbi:uncharacterized protein BJ171DRAFT_496962 [Polychytrium aggregatum]|uniref:uncharacterized protein n=1 Tax=Polychytrium aggregatum TaxID=110093 RepID=UPI0022FE19D9|nr:uncharacterized protein BJ171DRAFT_496962 [Polychytrium aggregatum]KAI9206786.1 hypothetical protein BJ171DRAFT_496962 [Polychytrium aggregatum]
MSSPQPPQPSKRAKPNRTSRACDACRSKHNKCNGEQPCKPCLASGLSCTYHQPQLKRGPQPLSSLSIGRFTGSPSLAGSPFSAGSPAPSKSESPPKDEKWGTDYCAIRDTANGATTYLGPTALGGGVCLEQCPRNSQGLIEFRIASASWTSQRIPRAESLPFSEEATSVLIKAFFHSGKPLGAMIHRPDFDHEYQSDTHSKPFSLLVWTMCLFAVLQNESLEMMGIQNVEEIRQAMIQHCRSSIKKLKQHPHIHTLRALILWSYICLDSTDAIKQSASLYMRLAWSMAVELAIHLNMDALGDPPPNAAAQKANRSTFFVLYALDCLSALLTGRPVLIRDDAWDPSLLDLQSADDDWRFLTLMVDLGRISGDMICNLNGPRTASVLGKQQSIGQQAAARLDRFWSKIPPHYREASQGERRIGFWLQAQFHCLRILASRMISPKLTPTPVASARAIVRCMRAFSALCPGKHAFQISIISHSTIVAASLLLDVILGGPTTEFVTYQEKITIICELNEILTLLDSINPRASNALHRMIEMCINRQDIHHRPLAGAAQHHFLKNHPLETIDPWSDWHFTVAPSEGRPPLGTLAPSGASLPLGTLSLISSLGTAQDLDLTPSPIAARSPSWMIQPPTSSLNGRGPVPAQPIAANSGIVTAGVVATTAETTTAGTTATYTASPTLLNPFRAATHMPFGRELLRTAALHSSGFGPPTASRGNSARTGHWGDLHSGLPGPFSPSSVSTPGRGPLQATDGMVSSRFRNEDYWYDGTIGTTGATTRQTVAASSDPGLHNHAFVLSQDEQAVSGYQHHRRAVAQQNDPHQITTQYRTGNPRSNNLQRPDIVWY